MASPALQTLILRAYYPNRPDRLPPIQLNSLCTSLYTIAFEGRQYDDDDDTIMILSYLLTPSLRYLELAKIHIDSCRAIVQKFHLQPSSLHYPVLHTLRLDHVDVDEDVARNMSRMFATVQDLQLVRVKNGKS